MLSKTKQHKETERNKVEVKSMPIGKIFTVLSTDDSNISAKEMNIIIHEIEKQECDRDCEEIMSRFLSSSKTNVEKFSVGLQSRRIILLIHITKPEVLFATLKYIRLGFNYMMKNIFHFLFLNILLLLCATE
jgi:ABC-type multidrug transport system ATPase subunit